MSIATGYTALNDHLGANLINNWGRLLAWLVATLRAMRATLRPVRHPGHTSVRVRAGRRSRRHRAAHRMGEGRLGAREAIAWVRRREARAAEERAAEVRLALAVCQESVTRRIPAVTAEWAYVTVTGRGVAS